eukprot:Em0001g2026a
MNETPAPQQWDENNNVCSFREPELIFRLAPTHVFVSFDDDNSNSVVPVKLKNDGKGDSKVGAEQEMNSVLDQDDVREEQMAEE